MARQTTVFENIKGFIDTSFLDWDGSVVSVIFLSRCNFRCPFCHNHKLVVEPESFPSVEFEQIKTFLIEHKLFIDGVCITGGEPTLYDDLHELCHAIKDLGFLVKLDTNGTHPEIVQELLDKELIDGIAMDVKAPLNEKYEAASGVKTNGAALKKSIELILASDIDYEFRTTVVPTLLKEDDILVIAADLKGAKKYVLQQFTPENAYSEALRGVKPYDGAVLRAFAEKASVYVPTIVRGIK